MKRTVALWAAVSMFVVATWAVDAVAQYDPPQTPPPPPSEPTSAAGDTLREATEEKKPAATAPPASADTMTAAARIRRAQASKMTTVISLGLGGSMNHAPEAFTEEYNPGFGILIDGGVRRWNLEASLSFDYSFFFTNRRNPEDLNVFNMFVNLKYRPLATTARPYVLACAGWWRSWIVDALDPNDPPLTVEHEVDGGDNVYGENVLGFGVGGGVEIEIDKVRRIFLEGRYVQGQTRETQNHENMVIIPFRLGLTWEIQ